jgi:hypothetical protein
MHAEGEQGWDQEDKQETPGANGSWVAEGNPEPSRLSLPGFHRC